MLKSLMGADGLYDFGPSLSFPWNQNLLKSLMGADGLYDYHESTADQDDGLG